MWARIAWIMTIAGALASAQDVTHGRGGDGETTELSTCPSKPLDSTSFMQTVMSTINRRNGGIASTPTTAPLGGPEPPTKGSAGELAQPQNGSGPEEQGAEDEAPLGGPEPPTKGSAGELAQPQNGSDPEEQGAEDDFWRLLAGGNQSTSGEDEGLDDHLVGDMVRAMSEADSDEEGAEELTGCPDGLVGKNGWCAISGSEAGGPSSFSPSLIKEEQRDRVTLLSLNPFNVAPIKKHRLLYTWHEHCKLPIHHRIEYERQCNGTVGYMCGVHLERIHKHVELMDQDYELLDVHKTMRDPTKTPLTESQFPLTLIFMDREDAVKENGEFSWDALFEAEIEKTKELVKQTEAKLEAAKKEKDEAKDDERYQHQQNVIGILEDQFEAECDAEQKVNKQLWEIKKSMIKADKTLSAKQVEVGLDKLVKAGEKALKRQLKRTKHKKERLMEKWKAGSYNQKIKDLEKELDTAEANQKWLPRLKDTLVEEMEEKDMWSTVKQFTGFKEEKKEDGLITAQMSHEEGLKVIKEKGTLVYFLTKKVSSKIEALLDFGVDYGKEWGEMQEDWQSNEVREEEAEKEVTAEETKKTLAGVNPTAHISLLLTQAKILILAHTAALVAHVPFVGGFLSFAITLLVETIFIQIGAQVKRAIDNIMKMIVKLLTTAIVTPIVNIWVTASGEKGQNEFDNALGRLLSGAEQKRISDEASAKTSVKVKSTGAKLERGLKDSKAEIKGNPQEEIVQVAEETGEARASMALLNYFNNHYHQDDQCSIEAMTEHKQPSKCGDIKVENKAQCYLYHSRVDAKDKEVPEGMSLGCTPSNRWSGCTERQGSPCKPKDSILGSWCLKAIGGVDGGSTCFDLSRRNTHDLNFRFLDYGQGLMGSRVMYGQFRPEGDGFQGYVAHDGTTDAHLIMRATLKNGEVILNVKKINDDQWGTVSYLGNKKATRAVADPEGLPQRDPAVFGCFAVIGGGNADNSGPNCDRCNRGEDYGSTFPECMCLGENTDDFKFKLYADGVEVQGLKNPRYFNLQDSTLIKEGAKLECQGELSLTQTEHEDYKALEPKER